VTRQSQDDRVAKRGPPILDVALRGMAECAVAGGSIWAAATAYVEVIGLIVQWDSGLQGVWWAHAVLGMSVVAARLVQLRRPGRLVLHALRSVVFLCLSALFCANMVVWNGGPSSDHGLGMLVVLLP
jgi:hypothetical protein